jgi:hypothetical protein
MCGTAACFAGLISIVANDIPELKKHYTSSIYTFSNWGIALQDFHLNLVDTPCNSVGDIHNILQPQSANKHYSLPQVLDTNNLSAQRLDFSCRLQAFYWRKIMDKMNTKKFKVFVEALESLPEHIRNNKVDMQSVEQPVCGTAGCFAGLISIVAEDIPVKE